MDFGSGVNGVQLDLFDFGLRGFGIGGALFGQFGGSGANASVGVVDVVEENFLGVVPGCRDPKTLLVRVMEKGCKDAHRLKKRPTPSLPSDLQYCSNKAWWTHCLE